MNRQVAVASGLALFCAQLSSVVPAQQMSTADWVETHALTQLGDPKYGPEFDYFDYVNPDAPKGGQLVLSAIGTYDNFNRYAQRGLAAAGSTEFYDSLLTPSGDEVGAYYPLIAESLRYRSDYSEVIFTLNPAARHQDGEPITADDIVFTFNKFIEEGVPFVRTQYEPVAAVEALSEREVRFRFHEGEGTRSLMIGLASLPVLPQHYWEARDFSQPLNEPPLGSGAYRVADFSMGQWVEYERLDDYWAQDIPSRRGTLNFDRIRYDYYRDTTVALEAFKAGEYDLRQENVARQWARDYTGPAFDRGDIVTEMLPHNIPQNMQAFVFNIERPVFSDRRVRQALNLALDFQWMNQNLFYGQYDRTVSYFQNTPYMAEGRPSEGELEILEPLADQVPEAVFGEVWRPNETDGSGRLRSETRQALSLFREAGWELVDQRLTHTETGRQMSFELLLSSPTFERVALSLQQNLERMGVDMSIRIIDPSQFTNRLRERDFDLIANGYQANPYPNVGMRTAWHSDYIDSTWNTAGVSDPAIDALIDGIIANQEDEEALLHYGRAFDRVALWNFYVIPHWHLSSFRVAYWDQFQQPEVRPDYELGVDTWWFDADRARQLQR